jgi:hypothetical protein
MELREIPLKIANELIVKNYWTHKISKPPKYSLGIYIDGDIKGVIQLGWGVNPKETQKKVKGTKEGEWLELVKMWTANEVPPNTGSKAMGLMFQWIRDNQPHIKWLITFANGAAGHVGTQYQASNWIYTGYNKVGGMWVTKEGEMIHNLTLMYNDKIPNTKRETLESIYGTPLYRVVGGQFRYFYFIHKGERKNLTLDELPYPKQRDIQNYIEILDRNWEGPKPLWDEVAGRIRNRAERWHASTINTIWW